MAGEIVIHTAMERLIIHEAGGNTVLAGKLLAIHRNLPEVFTCHQLVAIARLIRYADQIADESLGSVWRADLDQLKEEL